MRRVCFVTGTRAEFGLMRSTLDAIAAHPKLALQIIATGMHLDRSRGRSIEAIGQIDAIVRWPANKPREVVTGQAMAAIAGALQQLKSDVVLVVGDRVEAFAAAAAAAIGGRAVAHVHGGDRALGQLDDSLRHAISKLAHIHFPATADSANRLRKMGEEIWRIHRVGSPGLDGIRQAAADYHAIFPDLRPRQFALFIVHPVDADDRLEQRRTGDLLAGIRAAGVGQIVAIDPNNDPGAAGIIRALSRDGCPRASNLPRGVFLGLLRDAAFLAGNSSAGMIEAASFHTPVVDVGPRQLGRQCAADVVHIPYGREPIRAAAAGIWNNGRPRRSRVQNPYQTRAGAGAAIADILGRIVIDDRMLKKLIAY